MAAGDTERDLRYLDIEAIDHRVANIKAALAEAEVSGTDEYRAELRAELAEAAIERAAHIPQPRTAE